MDSILDVKGLSKRFRSLTAVEGLSFTLSPGEALGLLGPAGAGKTTTLRLVQGALRPSSGSVSLFGHTPGEAGHNPQQVAFVYVGASQPGQAQEHLIAPGLTCMGRNRLTRLLGEIGLGHLLQRRPRPLGPGERLRLSLGAALAKRPQMLVLDAPTSVLDRDGCHWLQQVLLRYVTDGGALLVSSRVLSEIERVVDRVVVINQGQRFSGDLEDMRSHSCPTLECAYMSLVSRPELGVAA